MYEELCNLFIKPARQSYSEHDLGPVAVGPHGTRQNFSLASQQGHELKASFFRTRGRATDACVLYLHSFNGSRLESLRYAGEVLQAGLHFCSFDFAGCGNSGGEYVTLGCNERWDVLRLVQHLRLRFAATRFFLWGRSMGAVAAIKFYLLLAQQQQAGNCTDVVLLGLVLDSAFISLKRMVVEAAQSRLSVPGLLVKAAFMVVSSSIEQRAGFKVEELELTGEVEAIRCATLLVASKEDSFVHHSHSEEIFARLKLHDAKEIEYARGEHYESRDSHTLASIYSFFQKRLKKYADLRAHQHPHHHHLQGLSLEKHPKSLRKYEPKHTLQERQPKGLPSGELWVGSDKKIGQQKERKYQTEKKIEEGQGEKQSNGLHSKSKPNFVCRIEQICSSHRVDELEKALSKSTERTQEQADAHENHCNIITNKLRKKPRNQRERIIEFKDRNDIEDHPFRPTESYQFKQEVGGRGRPKVSFTMVQPSTPPARPGEGEAGKKPSMTAQQYKNSQIKIIKGVVGLSPGVRRRAEKASCTDLKAKEDLRSGEQAKSMKSLIRLGGEALSFGKASSMLNGGGRE